jgi:hypothetical protein
LVEIALNFELQKNQFVSVYRDRKLTFLLDFFVAYNRTKISPKCFKISICMDAFVSDFFEIYFLKLYEKKGSMVVLQGFSTYFFISNAIFDAMHGLWIFIHAILELSWQPCRTKSFFGF